MVHITVFTKKVDENSVLHAMDEMADDLQIAGPREASQKFYSEIIKCLRIRRYVTDQQLIFNGVHMDRNNSGCVKYKKKENLQECSPAATLEGASKAVVV